ncbi:MAG: ribonuclease III [Verrucomicrobiota bacterium]
MSDLPELQARLGYRFQNIELLRLALTHPSIAHEANTASQTNQRLEFLGDSVLELVLTRELYDKFPAYGEGPLTQARAQLVNSRSLAARARQLELGRHLLLSRGEETSGGRERSSSLADGYEAVLGALYLDGGFDVVREFVLREFAGDLGQFSELPNLDNPKGDLQELLQGSAAPAPQYEVVSVSGPDHDRVFECRVNHEGKELARGTGKSKKLAESAAALAALQVLRAAPVSQNPSSS